MSTWRSRCLAVALLLGLTPLPPAVASPVPDNPKVISALTRAAQRAGLRLDVMRLALQAHRRVWNERASRHPLLTVIDYSLASRVRRLWVLDLNAGTVLAHELVAHGRRSGADTARYFSNRSGSLQSTLGTFLTGSTYRGEHGLSLRLRGLDPGLNDRAEARGIVMHGAQYVNDSIIAKLGRLGRSQGCPALSIEAAKRVIGLVKEGTVLFAYYPSSALERALNRRTL